MKHIPNKTAERLDEWLSELEGNYITWAGNGIVFVAFAYHSGAMPIEAHGKTADEAITKAFEQMDAEGANSEEGEG